MEIFIGLKPWITRTQLFVAAIVIKQDISKVPVPSTSTKRRFQSASLGPKVGTPVSLLRLWRIQILCQFRWGGNSCRWTERWDSGECSHGWFGRPLRLSDIPETSSFHFIFRFWEGYSAARAELSTTCFSSVKFRWMGQSKQEKRKKKSCDSNSPLRVVLSA